MLTALQRRPALASSTAACFTSATIAFSDRPSSSPSKGGAPIAEANISNKLPPCALFTERAPIAIAFDSKSSSYCDLSRETAPTAE